MKVHQYNELAKRLQNKVDLANSNRTVLERLRGVQFSLETFVQHVDTSRDVSAIAPVRIYVRPTRWGKGALDHLLLLTDFVYSTETNRATAQVVLPHLKNKGETALELVNGAIQTARDFYESLDISHSDVINTYWAD